MRIGAITVKAAATAAGIVIALVGIYVLGFFLGTGDGKEPDISVRPGVFNGKDELQFPENGEKRRSVDDRILNDYFSVLEASDDPRERRRAAFLLRYLATPGVEEQLLNFLADSDAIVAQSCSEALMRIWMQSDSQRANHFSRRARKAWESGEIEKTITLLRNMAKLDPDIPDMYRFLADALMERGDIPRATDAARKAVDLKPEHFAAHYILARCKVKLGEEDIAKHHINKALEIYPTYAAAKELKEKMQN